MVSICISLMAGDAEHCLIYLLDIHSLLLKSLSYSLYLDVPQQNLMQSQVALVRVVGLAYVMLSFSVWCLD